MQPDTSEYFRLYLNRQGGVDESASEDAPYWEHFRIESGAEDELVERAKIDAPIAEYLLVDNARPRASAFEKGILVVLRGANFNAGADPEDMVSIRAWLEPGRLVTVSPRRVFTVEDIRGGLMRGAGPSSPSGVLVSLADGIVDRMVTVIDDYEERTDALFAMTPEEREQSRTLQDDIVLLRSGAALLRRHLTPQRDAILQLAREAKGAMFSEVETLELREVADRTIRFVEELDSVRERATVLQDEIKFVAAERMNRNMYVLSIVAAIFLPLSLFTGLLGINVGGIPGTESPDAFWIVTVGLLLLVPFEIWFLRRTGLI
ncbi:MAG: zinc transporter ZntB [Planctomycetes bacterium]|nr:zinc transporter ZntB [Planctomycetota bacterium]